MEIIKLNCTACGAPISIPEDVDFLNCTSCGSALAVQRGEGYVTLKMVKEVTEAIKKTGADTESAIRDGTYATKTELQRLQLSQEISMVEMQLNSIQGEIRGLERAVQSDVANPRITKQRYDLNFELYRLAERLRNLRWNLFALNSPDPNNDLVAVESQVSSIGFSIQALEKSERSRPDVNNALSVQKKLAEEFNNKLLQIKIKAVKQDLLSFGLTPQSATDLVSAENCCKQIRKDVQDLERAPRTPENLAVLKELRQQYDDFYRQWRNLETQHVQANVSSLDFPDPKGLNSLSIQANLAQIQSDIQILSVREKNEVVLSYLKNLQAKEKRYQKALAKAEGKTFTLLGVGGLIAGIGIGLKEFSSNLFGKPVDSAIPLSLAIAESGDQATPDTSASPDMVAVESPATPQPLYNRRRLLTASGLGLFILALASCLGFGVFAAIPTQVESTWAMGMFFLSIFVGFVGGISVFFKSTQLLPVKPIVKLAGIALAVLIGGVLLSLAIASFFPAEVAANILIAAMCLVPIATISVFVVGWIKMKSARKTPA